MCRIAIGTSHVDAEAVGDAVADTGYTLGIGLWCLSGLEPVAKVCQQLVVVFEPGAKAEAMVTRGIDIHGTLVASIAHGRIVGQTVGDSRHQTVVAGRDDDGRRRQMALYGILRGILLYQLRVLVTFLAQEVDARPLV